MLPAGKPLGGTADGGMKMLQGVGDGPVGSCWYAAELHGALLPPLDVLAAAAAVPAVLWLVAAAAVAAGMVKLLLLVGCKGSMVVGSIMA